MSENTETTPNKRKIWVRGFFMLLMIMIFQLVGTVIFLVMIFQFVMMLLTDAPIPRLVLFGRSLGRYLLQISNFLTFTVEEIPFPFNDWPGGEE